jgi:hypothetical protein
MSRNPVVPECPCCGEPCDIDCTKCPDHVTVNISGLTGDCEGLNGSYQINRNDQCVFGATTVVGENNAGACTIEFGCMNGKWRVAINCTSLPPDYQGKALLVSDGRDGDPATGCPPTGEYTMRAVDVSGSCSVPTVTVS